MKSAMRKQENHVNSLPHTGYLGTSRVVLNHLDVSTQADIQHTALSYGSEDEIMGRLHGTRKVGGGSTGSGSNAAHYSKQDIREQYCISDRSLGAVENDRSSLFGCLSSHHSSPCSTRSASSFLTSCVRQKVPSDENLYELYKRHPSEYAPYPKRHRNPWAPLTPEICRHDRDLNSSYFRRKAPTTDPTRYTWMPSDDESIRMEKPKSILEASYKLNQVSGPPSVTPSGVYMTPSVSLDDISDAKMREMLCSNMYTTIWRKAEKEATANWNKIVPKVSKTDKTRLVNLQINLFPSISEKFTKKAKQWEDVQRRGSSDPTRDFWIHKGPISRPCGTSLNNIVCKETKDEISNAIKEDRLSKKHVSFARSHTLTSFDDAMSSLSSSSSNISKMTRSQERLLDVRKTEMPLPITKQPEPSEQNVLILDKIKRMPMKTQATQTEAGLGRKPVASAAAAGQINLSPRTIQRVKMVSQGAQTNGMTPNGRRLTKSYSEAGSKFGFPPNLNKDFNPTLEGSIEHEPLQRTQSDEPPRSPFMVPSPPPAFKPQEVPQQSDTSSLSNDHESEDSAENKKEIFIDFKPQVPIQNKHSKRPLLKTASDGVIMIDKRKNDLSEERVVPEKPITSISHENIQVEDDEEEKSIAKFKPFFQKAPIRNEGIFKPLLENIYSSTDDGGVGVYGQDSIDEEFHENIVYTKIYNRQDSQDGSNVKELSVIKESNSPADEGVVPSVRLMPDKLSPFASNDSLANDVRDLSDGGWNESQVTVLQVDSGTDNGTALSSSEVTSLASPASAVRSLTPSSRRKHLLMLQHQQRSSFDTDALEEEFTDHHETYPKIIVDKTSLSKLEIPSPKLTSQQTSLLGLKRSLSPLRRRRRSERNSKTSESPPTQAESPQPAVVPDLLLARTDSGKTNTTDISESTTTDDYVTANSGTDSSRRSISIKTGLEKQLAHQKAPPFTHASAIASPPNLNNNDGQGSSFDSAKGSLDTFVADDMVVPSFSPAMSPSREVARASSVRSPCYTPVPQIRTTGRSTPSDDSSSCGSYSVGGRSTPDLLDRYSVPSGNPSKTWHGSDDEERSVHYSSSGYYESPMEDDITWKSPKHGNHTSKRRDFHLDLNNSKSHKDSYSFSNNGKTTKLKRTEIKLSPNSETLKVTQITEKKRVKTRTRSPMQGYKKTVQNRKTSPYREKSPYPEEPSYKATSDESSTGREYTLSQTSPRKIKKSRDNNRRKSLPRSPISQKSKKKISDSEERQPTSLPGSLQRSQSKSRKNPRGLQAEAPETTKKLASPVKSPPEDSAKLKALSAESLRSVSPGSDSVFYSDPSHSGEHQVHCTHCGKEVDVITTDDPDKSGASSNGHAQPETIVQPPAGFCDSPKVRNAPTPTLTGGRLYKKQDRRLKSEERSHAESRRNRYHSKSSDVVRAKSEERSGAKASSNSKHLRPMARSTQGSREQLKTVDSSPSVLPAAPDDCADDDYGVYDASYAEAGWIYVDEREEVVTVNAHLSPTDHDSSSAARRDSISSTESEQDFRKRYQAVTHRMVHRKSCLEMYKRQSSKSFECDKTITVHRVSGEFGFRIHGSKPVVVSAIEPNTPAESSGLEVGDIVLAVNGVSVLDKSHSEVVKIAHAGSDTLKLEVARTCYALNTKDEDLSENNATLSPPLCSGYLWKLSGYASGTSTNKWIRRWFCLKPNNCLYYYKTDAEKQPVGVLMLFDHEIKKLCDDEDALSKPFRFVIQRQDGVPLHLAADTANARNRWVEVIHKSIGDSKIVDEFVEETKRNLMLSPSVISQPDCFGYLIKLGNQWKSWSRRYCVLKDACLYFYQDANAKNAFGVAYLHGYRVQQASGSKKHAFEILPPDPDKKHFYFHTESDADRKRWIAALEYSIDRWMKLT